MIPRQLRTITLRIAPPILILLFLLFSLQSLRPPKAIHPKVTVSLASFPDRFSRLLPFTLLSLLAQSIPPHEIHVHILPQHMKDLHKAQRTWPRSLQTSPKIRIVQVDKDYGPGTKVVTLIRDKLLQSAAHPLPIPTTLHDPTIPTDPSHDLILVVDDDKYYPTTCISDLLHLHTTHPNAALGHRGWRIKPDLTWGVPLASISRHVILSSAIRTPYKVGILTANDGYLIQPRFFNATLLLDYENAPRGAYWMDDVWVNGNLARSGVERFVVPGSAPPVDAVTSGGSVIDGDMGKNGRAEANEEVLRWFKNDWEEGLWYVDEDGRMPEWKRWWEKPGVWVRWIRTWIAVGWNRLWY